MDVSDRVRVLVHLAVTVQNNALVVQISYKQTCETNEKAMRSSCFMTFVTPKRPVALCLISRPIPISTSHRRWEKLANLGRNFKDLPQLSASSRRKLPRPIPLHNCSPATCYQQRSFQKKKICPFSVQWI